MWTDISSLGAIIFYSISLALVIKSLFTHVSINEKIIFGLASIGIGFHTIALANIILAIDGQNMSILIVASIVSWLIAAILTIALPKFAIITLLPVVYGFSLLTVLGVWLVPSSYITHFEANPEVLIHICLALSSYSTLMIAAFYAIQLNIINNRLKSKKLNLTASPLPPLLTVEKQLFQLVLAGALLLTLSLMTGFFFLEDMLAQGKLHKTILSLAAWCVYSWLLWQHQQQGVPIKTAVKITIIGAALLTLAYFGSRLVTELVIS
ncbi:inner membrane protein YpjD [Psychrobium sp. 1_MG-2023]|uniref:cytochrome C assembly family protein n=1 Tax=Psychrobium sp. 1_MG-2023 TaxID=3062624 RepID=UPI000C346D62|nr:cytochrome c biogenesis protein CcsA [Psychrobium sp. 1_MG-2023]MDP2562047.1 cytochrome c biogenesis protein CcsA [Psychrobium sp. 1_MG-2023]PKF58534.1 cytochrome C assembly protein [Alteromonadales bacterium alter-6D02]